jgi:hypothetical protein
MTTSTLGRDETVPVAEDTVSTPLAVPGETAQTQTRISRHEHRETPKIPSLRDQPRQTLVWILEACVGLFSLVTLLALTAAIPVVNLLALGYLMKIQQRIAQTGKLRSAFYLLPAARRLTGIILGVALWLLPIQFLAGAARDSWLLAPGTTGTWLWTAGLVGASLLITAHLLLALGCGGGWWRFVRPLNNIRRLRASSRSGEYWRDAHEAIYEFAAAFRFPQLLRLGILGYATVYLWLVVPTLLFTMLDDPTSRWQIVVFVTGCVTLTLTLLLMPLLLAHVATEGRWRAILEFKAVRKLAGQTPFCWAIATAVLFATSMLPMLYTALLKNQIPPHDDRWDLMLVFIATVVPARVLVGWVYHRATQRTRNATSWPWRIWQGVNGVALCFGVGWYVYFLHLAQTGGELGQRAVWQFQALLLPLPF